MRVVTDKVFSVFTSSGRKVMSKLNGNKYQIEDDEEFDDEEFEDEDDDDEDDDDEDDDDEDDDDEDDEDDEELDGWEDVDDELIDDVNLAEAYAEEDNFWQ